MRKMDAILRYNFRIEPDELNDDEWAKRWNEWVWLCGEMNKKR
jgi:hypothetical protein